MHRRASARLGPSSAVLQGAPPVCVQGGTPDLRTDGARDRTPEMGAREIIVDSSESGKQPYRCAAMFVISAYWTGIIRPLGAKYCTPEIGA